MHSGSFLRGHYCNKIVKLSMVSDFNENWNLGVFWSEELDGNDDICIHMPEFWYGDRLGTSVFASKHNQTSLLLLFYFIFFLFYFLFIYLFIILFYNYYIFLLQIIRALYFRYSLHQVCSRAKDLEFELNTYRANIYM